MAQQQQHLAYYPPAMYPSAPDDAVLLARLCEQVDFYFSPQNLAKDTFLSSLLERHDNAVPLETIASFPKVRKLHAIGRLGMTVGVPQSQMPPADPAFLAKALEDSHVVTVSNNGQWIHLVSGTEGTSTTATTLQDAAPSPIPHATTLEGGHAAAGTSTPSSPSTTASSAGVPTHPIYFPNKEPTTLVLYGLAPETTFEDVMKVVSSPGPTHVTPVDTNAWHVVFDTEEHAMAALVALQTRKIHGITIHASLLPRTSTFVPQHQAPPQYYPQQQQQQQHAVVMPQGYPVYDPYYNAAVMQQQQQQQQLYGAYPNMAMNAPPPYGQPPVYYHHARQHAVPPPQEHMPVPYSMPPYPMPPRSSFSPPPVPPQPLEVRRQEQFHHKKGGNASSNRKSRGASRAYPNRNEPFHTESNPHPFHDAKRKNTRKNTRKYKKSDANVLEKDFPALVVENENKAMEPNVPKTAGYAAALKKQPANTTTRECTTTTMDAREFTTTTSANDGKLRQQQTPSGESTAQLEQDLSQLKVSNTVDTEQEFWEEEEAPEVW